MRLNSQTVLSEHHLSRVNNLAQSVTYILVMLPESCLGAGAKDCQRVKSQACHPTLV